MGFPWIFSSNFESGTNAEWDTETDTASRLDFPSYKTLAQYKLAPYRGAYCMRVAAGSTSDADVLEGDLDLAANAVRYFRFYICFSDDFTGSANDTVNLFEAQDASHTIEIAFGFRVVGIQ